MTVQKGVPYGWTLTLDSGSTTAASQGSLGVGYGVEQNPFGAGQDDFVIQLQGYAGTGSPLVTLSQPIQAPVANAFATGSTQRAICRVKISAGPNGHLYGLTGAVVRFYNSNTGAFVPPGLSSGSYTLWSALHGGGAISFNDASLLTGAPGVTSTSLGNVLTLDELTPQAQVEGGGTNTAQMSFYVTSRRTTRFGNGALSAMPSDAGVAMTTTYNLRAATNVSFRLTIDLSSLSGVYDVAASVIRMQARIAAASADPPVYEWCSSEQPGRSRVLQRHIGPVHLLRAEIGDGADAGPTRLRCKLELTSGAIIPLFAGRLVFVRGITRIPSASTADGNLGLTDTVTVDGRPPTRLRRCRYRSRRF